MTNCRFTENIHGIRHVRDVQKSFVDLSLKHFSQCLKHDTFDHKNLFSAKSVLLKKKVQIQLSGLALMTYPRLT